MVTPYMEHDLSGLLENPKVHFSEPQIKCYMLQLLEGLRYLHGVMQLTWKVQGMADCMTEPHLAPRHERLDIC